MRIIAFMVFDYDEHCTISNELTNNTCEFYGKSNSRSNASKLSLETPLERLSGIALQRSYR